MKKTYLLQLAIFLLMVVISLYGFSNIHQGFVKEDTQRVKEAIEKAARECYSIEGAYPRDIEYLKTHYGLFIQEDKYMVRYHYIAGNIMPDHDVFRRGE